jgi:ADP-dependent NAD(P)H-hydrate dehydratase / NAD(P)H-hydrate epimerase
VPSGVDVDTGRLPDRHVSADLTVTFGTHKIAHLVDPAAQACGVVHLVDIGLDLLEAPVEALQPVDVARLLPVPGPFEHKYTRGVVGVRAGSQTYPGAAVLCTSGAVSGLAGMVRYSGSAADAVRARHPEIVASEGRVQAWVVGSGGDSDAEAALADALADGVPTVVDADALMHVAQGPQGLVLTPHAGELARMLDVERAAVEADQLAFASRAAAEYDAVVLLKGRHTLVARPDGRVRVTTSGVSWLAVAGAGDVLAGVIGSLLAAGLDPWDAAAAGSWLHGAAATRASGGGPLTATAVADAIPEVVRALRP